MFINTILFLFIIFFFKLFLDTELPNAVQEGLNFIKIPKLDQIIEIEKNDEEDSSHILPLDGEQKPDTTECLETTKKREKYISLLSDDFIENDSDDDDDTSSTSSGMSACSLMSTMSGEGWKPMAKHMVWVIYFLSINFGKKY